MIQKCQVDSLTNMFHDGHGYIQTERFKDNHTRMLIQKDEQKNKS